MRDYCYKVKIYRMAMRDFLFHYFFTFYLYDIVKIIYVDRQAVIYSEIKGKIITLLIACHI